MTTLIIRAYCNGFGILPQNFHWLAAQQPTVTDHEENPLISTRYCSSTAVVDLREALSLARRVARCYTHENRRRDIAPTETVGLRGTMHRGKGRRGEGTRSVHNEWLLNYTRSRRLATCIAVTKQLHASGQGSAKALSNEASVESGNSTHVYNVMVGMWNWQERQTYYDLQTRNITTTDHGERWQAYETKIQPRNL